MLSHLSITLRRRFPAQRVASVQQSCAGNIAVDVADGSCG